MSTRRVYQAMVEAYRQKDRRLGKFTMGKVIDFLTTGVSKSVGAVTHLGRTLVWRAGDILAYFDQPGTSNGPSEAINGRLEHRGLSPGDEGIWRTTWPGACWPLSGSGRSYTLDYNEPE